MESMPLHNFLKLLLFISILRQCPNKLSAASEPVFPKEALPTKFGYLPVNSTTSSAIFYTFYEAQTPKTSVSQTPVLIWLQGGPGCSSMQLLGPWLVSSPKYNVNHVELKANPGSWNRLFGLLFLDNPIGVGFSIASTAKEIPRDQHTVGKHLFAAITSFIALDPSFNSRPIYVTRESYGGKYVPSIGYYISEMNAKLPLSKRVNFAVNAFFLGLINEKQKTLLEKLQAQAVGLTKAGSWSEAADARDELLQLLQNMTGLATLYDFRKLVSYDEEGLVSKFLNNVDVKKALGVNVSMIYEECSDAVGEALYEDVMKSVKYMVEYLVKKSCTRFDLRDGVVSTEAWVKKMKWEGIGKFLEADRKVWRVDGKLAGYVQKWGSLSHVVVAGAGHLVPTDQPLNSQAMIEDWVLGRGLFAKNKF
ncbi:LOW QUALITY PROTEIN: hypothetical protein RJ639_040612 [Escallonia herrerae]|uniref:Carboxypeptidase n=1 Tax=Escallonia herrerae TaxID=1293975 RepID=A0AA88WK15_9ASTE|nr:LOW QUALITY PROTEIN: hypothetical protein RJ639_040612 [Escallonia herrerae]